MEEQAEGSNLTSIFKDSLNSIYRIDQLWQDAHKHSRNGELSKYNFDLDRIWMELVGDLELANTKDNQKVEDFALINKKVGLGFKVELINAKNPDHKSLPLFLYKALMEKEEFLRRLQNYLDKGTAYKDEDEDDVD